MSRLPGRPGRWCASAEDPLRLAALVTPHEPRDVFRGAPARRGLAVEIASTGLASSPAASACGHLPPGVGLARPKVGQSNLPWFFLAYGPAHGVHRGTDRFDFADSYFRLSRFASLFDRGAKLTDPAAFLSVLQYRGLRKGRHPARRVLAQLAEAAGEILEIDVGPLSAAGSDLGRWWSALPAWKRRALVPVLDAARHAVDASPRAIFLYPLRKDFRAKLTG